MPVKNKTELAEIAHTVTGIGWADKNQACFYAGVSGRTLDKWIENGLPRSRIGGCVRIKYTDIDAYLIAHQKSDEVDLEECSEMVSDMLNKFNL